MAIFRAVLDLIIKVAILGTRLSTKLSILAKSIEDIPTAVVRLIKDVDMLCAIMTQIKSQLSKNNGFFKPDSLGIVQVAVEKCEGGFLKIAKSTENALSSLENLAEEEQVEEFFVDGPSVEEVRDELRDVKTRLLVELTEALVSKSMTTANEGDEIKQEERKASATVPDGLEKTDEDGAVEKGKQGATQPVMPSVETSPIEAEDGKMPAVIPSAASEQSERSQAKPAALGDQESLGDASMAQTEGEKAQVEISRAENAAEKTAASSMQDTSSDEWNNDDESISGYKSAAGDDGDDYEPLFDTGGDEVARSVVVEEAAVVLIPTPADHNGPTASSISHLAQLSTSKIRVYINEFAMSTTLFTAGFRKNIPRSKEITVAVNSEGTLEDLKKRIEEIEGLPASQQMFYSDRTMTKPLESSSLSSLLNMDMIYLFITDGRAGNIRAHIINPSASLDMDFSTVYVAMKPTGKLYPMSRAEARTPELIKARIQNLEGIPVSQQRLTWGNGELKPGEALHRLCVYVEIENIYGDIAPARRPRDYCSSPEDQNLRDRAYSAADAAAELGATEWEEIRRRQKNHL